MSTEVSGEHAGLSDVVDRRDAAGSHDAVLSAAGHAIATSRSTSQAALVCLYTCAIFIGAALIFLLQPMVAKMALPVFGGSPAVWNTSLVFFQAVLLGGYLYAHLSTRYLGLRRQPLVHLAVLLLPLVALPIRLRLNGAQPDGVAPVLWLLLMLAFTAGVPFFVVSTASPTLQRWFSGLNHPAASDPYFLYAASNAGSLIALLAYPTVIEPNFSLAQQGTLWAWLYFVFVALCALSALALRQYPGLPALAVQAVRLDAIPLTWRVRLRWVFLAFVPSSLMVGATNYISTDVASAPFLWVLPLSIYLLTFIVAFSHRQRVSLQSASVLLAVAVVVVTATNPAFIDVPISVAIVSHLVLLFAAGLLAHTRLALDRPPTVHLTEFYLLISIGGVLGGAFNALLAPLVVNSVLEYPIVIVLAVLLRPGPKRMRDSSRIAWALDYLLPVTTIVGVIAIVASTGAVALAIVASAAVALVSLNRPIRFAMIVALLLFIAHIASFSALHAERTFFGVHRVTETSETQHSLAHGTTIHGVQDMRTAMSRAEPLSYYSRSGPIGQVFAANVNSDSVDQVGIVGLGAGSLAAYGESGQTFTFFEIDPTVVRIASDQQYFTYLADSRASLRIEIGDGRLQLEEEPDGFFDLIILDAFSSDSVPVHLLTVEAVELYFEKVHSDGIVAMHISNRNLELEPVVAAVARELDLFGAAQQHTEISREDEESGITPSHWVLLARSPEVLRLLLDDDRWRELDPSPNSRAWTDDFSNIISTIRWTR